MADSTASKNTVTGHTDHWNATATKAGLYEFKTGGKFVDRNIDFTVPASTTSKTDGTASATAGTTSVTGMEVVETNTGYSVTATGGSASTTAASLTASVGFIDSEVSSTSPAKSATGETSTKYIKAATKSSTNGTATATAGTTSVTGMETTTTNTGFSVTATGGSASTTAASVSVSTGYVGTAVNASTEAKSATGESETKYIKAQTLGTSNTGTQVAAITPSTSYQYISASTGYQGTARKWTINPISSATAATYEAGTTTVAADNTVTSATFYVKTAGYSGAANKQLLAPAHLANSPTSGVTYVDISDTNSAPVLVSDSGLYINKGYIDNLYISLSKLTPDGASAASSIKSGMLTSVSAYDNDGKLVTGDIVAKSASNVAVSGKTVTTPAGYYASTVQKSVADGSYTLATSGTQTYKPTINANANGNITVTRGTSKPASGYYVAVSSAANTGTLTPTVTITDGYLTSATAATSTTSAIVGAAASDVTYFTVTSGSVTNNTSGGTSSGTITAGSQIKIGAGYYPEDVYYTAQSASDAGAGAYSASGIYGGFTAASSATSYYVTPKATITTAGYLDTGDKTGNTIYIPTTTITGALSATSSSSSYAAPTLATTAPTGAYITFVGSGTGAGTGMVSTSVSGSSTKYLSVYEGTYSIT